MPLEIISRKVAKVAGLERYFTGKLCPHGHTSERYVRGRACVECGRVRQETDRAKNLERGRRYYAENPEKSRATYLNRTYGITPEQYADLHAAQGFGCCCCGETAENGGRCLRVDHHHGTGQVRGLLCDNCNNRVIAGLECAMTPLQIWAAIKAAEDAGQEPSPWLVYLHSWNQQLALHKMGLPKGKPEHFYLIGP